MQYGHVSGDTGGSKHSRKRKIATIGITSLVLVAMVVAVAVGVNHHGKSSDGQGNAGGDHGAGGRDLKASMKAIQTICRPTDYKQACIDSLSSDGNTTDPKQLIRVGFNATIVKITEAAKNSSMLQELEKDPRAKKALENCNELMDFAIADLKQSFDKVGHLDMSKIDEVLTELKIWLSASGTYLETCLDGFENTSSNAGEKMRKALKISAELTSNALAIVTDISSVLNSFQIPGLSRRLLSKEESKFFDPTTGDLPRWVSAEERRLLAASPATTTPNVIVAQDGSGKYKTISEALQDVPKKNNQTFIIYVKEGIYNEEVTIQRGMTHVMMIGDGPTKTKVSGNKNFIDGTPTFKTAPFMVIGDNFMAKDMGFENTAGAEKHQAVALRVQSDMSIFYNCQMDAYQDTLYAHTKRQFYRDCTISGTIDFIFGDAAVVFQNCKMVVRKPMANQQCIVTAQGRKDVREPTGTVLQNCVITSDPLYYPLRSTIRSFLGRPWKEYSRTIIMNTEIQDLIQPEGWLPWVGDFGLNTCFYAEINNEGPGSNMARRVKWAGVKTVPPDQAIDFTPGKFIQGDIWIPPTGVPYSSGLMSA
ncbi:Pectinesterase/pectinesterase inhibitor [Thalictrum thalictroides]|uniref:Pectinesterase n=1 Tax=Thalictrum thalictroides TaxID=46969 RepID=A0A7J6W6X7_THATH|nr:Pectinesterase/pectinesterase inhibitor [Thalictrum thalictroides]